MKLNIEAQIWGWGLKLDLKPEDWCLQSLKLKEVEEVWISRNWSWWSLKWRRLWKTWKLIKIEVGRNLKLKKLELEKVEVKDL